MSIMLTTMYLRLIRSNLSKAIKLLRFSLFVIISLIIASLVFQVLFLTYIQKITHERNNHGWKLKSFLISIMNTKYPGYGYPDFRRCNQGCSVEGSYLHNLRNLIIYFAVFIAFVGLGLCHLILRVLKYVISVEKEEVKNYSPLGKDVIIIKKTVSTKCNDKEVTDKENMDKFRTAVSLKELNKDSNDKEVTDKENMDKFRTAVSLKEPNKDSNKMSTKVNEKRMTDEEIMTVLRSIVSEGDPNEKYTKMKQIGQGGSGTVYTAVATETGLEVAVKKINVTKQLRKDFIITELLIMKKYKHPNIVNYLDSFLDGDELWIIMEYLGVGSMASVLSKTRLHENETAAVCKEILQAIQFLHQHNIVHRDIKSHNILLGKDWTIKLADFGTSAQLSPRTKEANIIGWNSSLDGSRISKTDRVWT
ncbi:uncharacterized protein LOC143249036 [Tachypleus tridentatus]|uniref:uncharacterized protein LOC143248841 n=1 Tax=Tachypleus tridentatus TaxID=6853 RepID=UPI003FD61AE2